MAGIHPLVKALVYLSIILRSLANSLFGMQKLSIKLQIESSLLLFNNFCETRSQSFCRFDVGGRRLENFLQAPWNHRHPLLLTVHDMDGVNHLASGIEIERI